MARSGLRDSEARGREEAVPPTRSVRARRLGLLSTRLLGGLAVLFLLARIAHLAWSYSPTFDEPKHLATGLVYLHHGWCCAGRDNTPLAALNALPLYLSGTFPSLTPEEMEGVVRGTLERNLVRWRYFRARAANLPVILLLLAVMTLFVRHTWGRGTALIALVLLACSPNLAAYASLVSPDFQVAATMFLAVAAASVLVVRGPSWRWIVVTGLGVGLALLSKFSALVLLPALPGAAVLVGLFAGGSRGGWRRGGRLVAAMSAACLMGLAIVLAAYELPSLLGGLAGLGLSPFDPRASSTALLAQAARPPAELHYGFLGGVERVREITRAGFPAYFMGEVGRKFWLYYPVAVLVKTPLALLLAAALGVVTWVRDRERRLWLLVPACACSLLVAAALASKMCLGVRHLLVLYPWLIVLGAAGLARCRGRARWVAALLLGWMLVGGMRHHPDELAYFNELAGGPAGGHRFLADANLDWSQDYYRLGELLEQRGWSDVIGILHGPFAPLTTFGLKVRRLAPGEIPHGIVAVSVSRLVGLGEPRAGGIVIKDFFAGRRPVARAGDSIWLFDVE